MSPEDEMQFWSNFANSVRRKDEKEKATAFWYALEPLVKDFRQALLCSLECRFFKNLKFWELPNYMGIFSYC